MNKALRLVPSLDGFLWLSCDELAMSRQVRVMSTDLDVTFEARPLFIVEGHHIAINNIREAIELRNLQGFGPQLNDTAVRLSNVHMERKQLHVCLCLSESDKNT